VAKKDVEKMPGSDQPGFDISRRTNEGDIEQIDGNGMGLPVDTAEQPASPREGTSGTDVGYFGPRRR
jgi:hypothetical protein